MNIRSLGQLVRLGAFTFLLAFQALSNLGATRSQWVEFHSMSVMVEKATTRESGNEYSLEFSYQGTSPANGEIGPIQAEGASHGGNLLLRNSDIITPEIYTFGLVMPLEKDVNANSIPDFFDVEETENGTNLFGLYQVPHPDGGWEERPIYATWIREAKNPFGTVTFNLPDEGLTFRHRYRLIQYEGDYRYSVTGNAVSGTVILARSDDTTQRLTGSMSMRVISATSLVLVGAELTTTGGASVGIGGDTTMGLAGDYFTGFATASDGFVDTPEGDYPYFYMVVENQDADNNGRADITQPDPPTPDFQPRLTITRVTEGLRITIFGEDNDRYMLQKWQSVPTGVWQDIQFVTMDVNPKSVIVPLERTGNWFFRLRL